jgi:hypothetical protein
MLGGISIKGNFVLFLILLNVFCITVFGQTTATDWFKGAENLTGYSMERSATQTIKLHNDGNDITHEATLIIVESANSTSTVDLSSLEAHALSSTMSQAETEGLPANSSNTSSEIYLIGNSTYVKDKSGNWTVIVDPRSAKDVWGENNYNLVLSLAKSFNLPDTEYLGSEVTNGVDTYKLKIVNQSEDYINLYNTALDVAAKLTPYPMFMSSVNRSEVNDSAKIEKTIWISKKSYLPVKYQSVMSFSMTMEIIGALDRNTGQMNMLNQSIRLGEISFSEATTDLYYDFDNPARITIPEDALKITPIRPT